MSGNTKIQLTCLACAIAGLVVVLCTTCLPGCHGEKDERKDAAPAAKNAFSDPQVQQEIKDVRVKRIQEFVIPYNRVRVRMEELIAQARAALPDGATDEQIKIELDGNPELYPEWKELYSRAEALVAQHKKSRREAFARLGSRLKAANGGKR